MPLISILTPCYNEEENVEELYLQVRGIFAGLPGYRYEHIFIDKLVFWNYFTLGLAPLVIGLFFFASVQLFFIGIIGEYVGSIHTQALKRPLVIEKERVNFE